MFRLSRLVSLLAYTPIGLPASRVARSPVFLLPYFTRDPDFRPFLPPPGGSRREEQISRILFVRLSRHSDDTVTRENFVYGPSIRI